MSKSTNSLGWGERLAIGQHFGMNDKQIAATFSTSIEEVATARELAQAGTIAIATDVDFSQYESELGVKKSTTKQNTATTTSKPATTDAAAPVTATKPKKEPKKRGRKGDKIKNAFAAIPAEPTDAEAFISEHGISMNVLRQGKRFDTTGLTGTVHVRKSKETGQLVVWRDDPSAE